MAEPEVVGPDAVAPDTVEAKVLELLPNGAVKMELEMTKGSII